MDDSPAGRATAFKALGDPTRLRIFGFLRACRDGVVIGDSGDVRPVDGATVGEVCCHITGGEKITSTVSFHLKELRLAGLVIAERRGKNIMYRINERAVECLTAYLGGDAPEDSEWRNKRRMTGRM